MKRFFYSLAAIVSNFFLLSAAHAVTISMNIPGTTPNSSSSPGAFVANFYQFALMIGGVLAFGVVVYGGVKYMTSAGNPSGQSDAKEWIEAALLGLLLLVGAYFILNVVNPQMTNLNLPNLIPVNIQATNLPPGGSQSITGQNGAVWCNSTTDGQCTPTADGFAQTCTLTGGQYACQSTGVKQTSTCGDPKLGHNGTCVPPKMCDMNGGGDWYCGTP